MGYVVFDEGCLWCRSLALLIRRVFNIEAIPLRRVAEDFGVRLSKGRIYVVNNGVNEGFKPLIKLIVGRGKLKSLRIIPSYIAYRIARKTIKGCGYSYGRRIFIKGILALALTAIITQKIPLTWSIKEDKHPILKSKIIKSIELKDDELKEAINKMIKSKDVNNIVNPDQLDLNKAIAVKHIIDVNGKENVLLAFTLPLRSDEASIYCYELSKPIDWFKSEAKLLLIRNDGIVVKGWSINGRTIALNGNEDYSDCPCITECQTDWDCSGPYVCARGCCQGDDYCLLPCLSSCTACSALCGANLGCWLLCAPIWCTSMFVLCWNYVCCHRGCKVCTLPPGP